MGELVGLAAPGCEPRDMDIDASEGRRCWGTEMGDVARWSDILSVYSRGKVVFVCSITSIIPWTLPGVSRDVKTVIGIQNRMRQISIFLALASRVSIQYKKEVERYTDRKGTEER